MLKYPCHCKEVKGAKEQNLAVQRMQDYIETHLDENQAVGTSRRIPVFALVFLSVVSGIHRADPIGIYPSVAVGKSGFADIDSLEECNYNEVGEIFTAAPTRMTRYLDEEKQKCVFYDSVDGKTYVRSQDLGKLTNDGNIYIEGRIKRIIIRPDGHNISPFAIEDIINADPRVKYSAVVGRDAEGYNEGKWAVSYIELKDEYKNMGIEQEVIDSVSKIQNEKLPPRDISNFYEFIDEMPLTNIGKIDFKELEKRETEKETAKHR